MLPRTARFWRRVLNALENMMQIPRFKKKSVRMQINFTKCFETISTNILKNRQLKRVFELMNEIYWNWNSRLFGSREKSQELHVVTSQIFA
jgi:hypothetical protein